MVSTISSAPLSCPPTVGMSEAAACCHGAGEHEPPSWFRIGLAIAIAGQGMFLSLGLNNATLAGEGPAYGGLTYLVLHSGLVLSCILVMALLGGPLAKATWQAARAKKITVEALFSLSLIGALVGSLVASISGRGSIYYEVVAVVLAVYSIGQQVARRQRQKTLAAADELARDFAEARVRLADGSIRLLPVGRVDPVQHVVLVAPGAAVTVDGVVAAGIAQVQETALTGETAPVVKRPGDHIKAGCYALDGALEITPDPPGLRAIDTIHATVTAARLRVSHAQAEADRLMQLFVPLVVAVSGLTFFGWFLAPEVPWWRALFHSMAVLLVACPCALGLATPIAVWTGLHRLGQLGLVARTGTMLDALAKVRLIVFDKTGTLSEESLQVADFLVAPEAKVDRAWLREAVAALEAEIPHPAARALAGEQAGKQQAQAVRLIPGHGVTGIVGARQLAVGSAELVTEVAALNQLAEHSPLAAQAKRRVYIALDGQPVAVALLAERLRQSTAQALHDLQALGIESRILTGDPEPAQAEIAGVPIEAGLTPEQKVAQVQAMPRQRIYVGDGLNDAAAMAVCPASIALDHGAALTTATGDAVLQGGALGALPEAVRLARRWRQQLQGNLRFAALYNVIGMGLAAAGILHPVVAAVLMVGSSFFVSLRALRGIENQGSS